MPNEDGDHPMAGTTNPGDGSTNTIPLSTASSGRVVRLHFACRASLPLGSFLRVTGSTLWAPGTVTASDPSDAQAVATETGDEAFHSGVSNFAGGSLGMGGTNVDNEESVNSVFYNPNAGLYASSVEMVTTPETYPIWKTRTPVVVVLGGQQHHHHHGEGGEDPKTVNLHHHRYRYMIVTPGADVDHYEDEKEEAGNNSSSNKAEKAAHHGQEGGGASTSNDAEGSHVVTLWENPFEDTTPGNKEFNQKIESKLSMASLRSARTSGVPSLRNLANLPYRTIDIDTNTATVIKADGKDEDAMEEDGQQQEEYTEDGVKIDTWDNAEDFSYRPYVIREALIKKNKTISRMESDITDISETASEFESSAASGVASTGSLTPVHTSTPSRRRIFFVCYHLPVIVTRDPVSLQWNACWSESLLAKTEGSSIIRYMDAHWVGTVSTNPPIAHEKDREAVRAVLAGMNCTPLFLEEHIKDAFYLGMCKQVLWPSFHNVDSIDFVRSGHMNPRDIPHNTPTDDETFLGAVSDWNQARLLGWWNAYQQVNSAFADSMSSTLIPGDTMWVHDYHLSLLPKMVADRERSKYGSSVIRKVYFLHIPFPTSKIFRELECGDAILEGILHSDLVGFHAFDHARHFLISAKRILGLNYESLVGGLIGVKYRGKTVLVTMSNVSVEPALVDSMLALKSVSAGADALRQKFQGRTIISGIDIAQRLSGVKYKLLAYERLLMDYPVWVPKIILVQRCLIPGSRRVDEASTIRELRFLVRRIQEKFGNDVIDYEEMGGTSVPIDRRLSLWLASDVLISTPIREGLNLLPLEYVFAKKAPETPGVVIASEFSAVNSILNGALRVNPFDLQSTASSIDKALTMDMQEREGRRSRDIEFVSTSPSDKWTKNVLRDLNDATTGSSFGDDDASDDASGIAGRKSVKSDVVDSVATFLAGESSRAFTHLNTDAVLRAYNATQKRVIILDFNGTIVIKEAPGKYLKREILGTSGFKPPVGVIKALAKLCEDPRNMVYVVSGDAQENVESAIGHIPGLGLAASNGVCFSPPTKSSQGKREWHEFDLGVDWDEVKKVVLPVMSKYTARTNGSFIKLTHSSIGWSYYSCDPEWGALQASHLVLELEKDLRAFDVRFVTLKGVIELVPRRLNKGLIVKKVLRDVAARNGGGRSAVDFILCMGDDISDEKMFTSVFSFIAEMEEDSKNVIPSPPVLGDEAHVISTLGHQAHDGDTHMEEATKKDEDASTFAFTVAVGKKASHASQYVNDATDVADLLVSMSSVDMPNADMCWNNEGTGAVLFA